MLIKNCVFRTARELTLSLPKCTRKLCPAVGMAVSPTRKRGSLKKISPRSRVGLTQHELQSKRANLAHEVNHKAIFAVQQGNLLAGNSQHRGRREDRMI